MEEPAWDVLVVDDETSVLSITELAWRGLRLHGRPVRCWMADSGSAARELLEKQVFAVAVIDVMMETPRAGLDLVRWMRSRAEHFETRIVIRTGQPGQAPELKVVIDYDINDYWHKTDLTVRRMRASLAGLLRSYRDLLELDRRNQAVRAAIATTEAARDTAAIASSLKSLLLRSVHSELLGTAQQVLSATEVLSLQASNSEFAARADALVEVAVEHVARIYEVTDLAGIDEPSAVTPSEVPLLDLLEVIAAQVGERAASAGTTLTCTFDRSLPERVLIPEQSFGRFFRAALISCLVLARGSNATVEVSAHELGTEQPKLQILAAIGATAIDEATLHGLLHPGTAEVEPAPWWYALILCGALVRELGGYWTEVRVQDNQTLLGIQLPFHEITRLGQSPPPLSDKPVQLLVRDPTLRRAVAELLRRWGCTLGPVGVAVTDDRRQQGVFVERPLRPSVILEQLSRSSASQPRHVAVVHRSAKMASTLADTLAGQGLSASAHDMASTPSADVVLVDLEALESSATVARLDGSPNRARALIGLKSIALEPRDAERLDHVLTLPLPAAALANLIGAAFEDRKPDQHVVLCDPTGDRRALLEHLLEHHSGLRVTATATLAACRALLPQADAVLLAVSDAGEAGAALRELTDGEPLLPRIVLLADSAPEGTDAVDGHPLLVRDVEPSSLLTALGAPDDSSV